MSQSDSSGVQLGVKRVTVHKYDGEFSEGKTPVEIVELEYRNDQLVDVRVTYPPQPGELENKCH